MSVIPFSNGTEFMDWLDRNCDQCSRPHHYCDPELGDCELFEALVWAHTSDGTLIDEAAEQLGVTRGVWRCKQFDDGRGFPADPAQRVLEAVR